MLIELEEELQQPNIGHLKTDQKHIVSRLLSQFCSIAVIVLHDKRKLEKGFFLWKFVACFKGKSENMLRSEEKLQE